MDIMTMVLAFLFIPFESQFITHEVFPITGERVISSEKFSTYRHYFAVSPDGNRVAFINSRQQTVQSYSLADGNTSTVASHTNTARSAWGPTKRQADTLYFSGSVDDIAGQGRRSNEVNIPIAIRFDRSGKLFVSDVGNRRVSMFDQSLAFETSFLLPSNISAPSDMRVVAGGNYLLGNRLLDSTQAINAGYHCNVLSPTGELLQSFAYTPKIAFDRNLWLGVYSLFDLDEQGNVYVAFTVEPIIYVYNNTYELTTTFGEIPEWWIPPPVLEQPRFSLRSEPDNLYGSWTRLMGVVYSGDGKLILCTESNGLIEGCSKPYILDIYTTDGTLFVGGIESDYLPVGVDSDNMIYFLSVTGDRLISTSFTKGADE